MHGTRYEYLFLALAAVSMSCTLHSENAPGVPAPTIAPGASCLDEKKDGSETDIDCGGPGTCPACSDYKTCITASDCTSLVCANAECQPVSCSDGVRNGSETDTDCGGSCSPCAVNRHCTLTADCASGVCSAAVAGICVAPSCADGVQNGTETDIDCGGSLCPACGVQKGCGAYTDCTTAHCSNNICLALPMCNQIHQLHPTVPSGIWVIDPGQRPADMAPFQAYCDMNFDGGGWTLVLAYAHQGGTNPSLNVSVRPLDPNNGFSHYSSVQLQQAVFSELRFFCTTSAHNRVISFKTSVANAIGYVQGANTNDPSYWNTGFTLLPGHTANLPASTNSGLNFPVSPLTQFPYFTSAAYHWGIGGSGNRWECDDFPGNFAYTTQHQVWVR